MFSRRKPKFPVIPLYISLLRVGYCPDKPQGLAYQLPRLNYSYYGYYQLVISYYSHIAEVN